MGKKNGFDLISDAHNRADHNINPYYGYNKIDSFTLAHWRASLIVSIIEFVIITVAIFLVVAANISDPSLELTPVYVILGIFWVLLFFRSRKGLALRKSIPASAIKPKEKKKQLPKRPKNYGRD